MRKLTSRERLERCYFHREVDCPGVYVRRGWPRNDPTYNALIELVDGQTDLKFGWSATSLISSYPTEARSESYSDDFERQVTTLKTPKGPLTSTRLVSLRGQPGLDETYFLKTEEDVEKFLSLPMPEIEGDVASFFETRKSVGDRGIAEVGLGINPAGRVAMLFGSEQFAIFSVTRRHLIYQLIDRQAQILINLVKYLIERGVGPFFSMAGQEYVAPPLHSPNDFYDFNVRFDKQITDLIHDAGGRVHVHCHGSLRSVINLFLELGADVLHPVEPPPLGDCPVSVAKAALKDKVCIEGNIQIADMYERSPDQIELQTRALIEDAFYDHKGLIVCPSASPYIRGAGEQFYKNFERMVEIVRSFDG